MSRIALVFALLCAPSCATGFALRVMPVDPAGTAPAGEEFIQRFAMLRTADRHRSTRDLVARFPDRALVVLREWIGTRAGDPLLRDLALLYEQQTGAAEVWSQALGNASRDPRLAGWLALRPRVRAALAGGAATTALELIRKEAPAPGAEPLIVLDALWLTGDALLAAGRAPEAVRAFQQAAQLADPLAPNLAAYLRLGWLDALGASPGAGVVWREAVERARQPLLRDPFLWQLLADRKPVSVPWPKEVLTTLCQSAADIVPVPEGLLTSGSSVSLANVLADAVVRAVIGHWHYERDEPRAALESLRRAETAAFDPVGQDRLHLAQARALLQLGLPGAAEPLLLRLSRDENSTQAPAAGALLGALRLAEGDTEQGRTLLRRAVEAAVQEEWPGRARAEADLGLHYLQRGEEERGRRWLSTARERCLRLDDWTGFVLCLEAEAAYHDRNEAREPARALLEQLQSLERKSGP